MWHQISQRCLEAVVVQVVVRQLVVVLSRSYPPHKFSSSSSSNRRSRQSVLGSQTLRQSRQACNNWRLPMDSVQWLCGTTVWRQPGIEHPPTQYFSSNYAFTIDMHRFANACYAGYTSTPHSNIATTACLAESAPHLFAVNDNELLSNYIQISASCRCGQWTRFSNSTTFWHNTCPKAADSSE